MGESESIIRVEGLGKKYVIDHQQEGRGRYQSLRDTLMNGMRAAGRRLRRPFARIERREREEFWALKDVSFEVKRGEVVGIIGRNGAGKSTLLKILSRITEPTKGRVTLHGRVASLLEVGTGFHPELTGRENVYLNGAILGMSRAEIKKKFDEIVAFAEVEKFLDTPVKRYSSGMYMRLAFAVAAHLEPEILIVDEVLAVGDAQFQEKCLGKMNSIAESEGRTVLFVSHNMTAVKQLCHNGVWLNSGNVQQIGPIHDVVRAYSCSVQSEAITGDLLSRNVKGDGQIELVSYRVTNAAGEAAPLTTREDLILYITLRVKARIGQPACGLSIHNEFGVLMTCINTVEQGVVLPALPSGEVTVCVRVNNVVFLPAKYTASFWVMNPQGHIYVMAEDCIAFNIAQTPLYGTCQVDHRWGCVYSDVRFSVESAVKSLALAP